MIESASTLSIAEVELFRKREEDLWREETRFDRMHMDRVLAPDFLEFGGSGKVHTREAVLSAPRMPINAELPLSDFRVRHLSADIVQVTYNTNRETDGRREYRRRSSIWTHSAEGWVLLFHQGTPYEPQNDGTAGSARANDNDRVSISKFRRIRFDVFGRRMVVEDKGEGWIAYWSGNEGKRRAANIPIPSRLDANGIAEYLDDLFHEAASPEHPTVRLVENME